MTAETIKKDTAETILAKYGVEYRAGEGDTATVRVGTEEVRFNWTKAGRLPPRGDLWATLRSLPAFQAAYPKYEAGTATGKPQANHGSALNPAFWVNFSTDELAQAEAAIKAARKEVAARERTALVEAATKALKALGIKPPKELLAEG